MKWIGLFQEQGEKFNFIAQHVAFFPVCFKYAVKQDLHVFLIEKLSTLKNHRQIQENRR